jgi:hypothetical protein
MFNYLDNNIAIINEKGVLSIESAFVDKVLGIFEQKNNNKKNKKFSFLD